jgi:hypothetical protein
MCLHLLSRNLGHMAVMFYRAWNPVRSYLGLRGSSCRNGATDRVDRATIGRSPRVPRGLTPEELTDGWAKGIMLAALSLARSED